MKIPSTLFFSSCSTAQCSRADVLFPFNVETFLNEDGVQTILLREVVLQALKYNLDITVSQQNRGVRITDILFEQAKLGPAEALRYQ